MKIINCKMKSRSLLQDFLRIMRVKSLATLFGLTKTKLRKPHQPFWLIPLYTLLSCSEHCGHWDCRSILRSYWAMFMLCVPFRAVRPITWARVYSNLTRQFIYSLFFSYEENLRLHEGKLFGVGYGRLGRVQDLESNSSYGWGPLVKILG